MFKLVLIFLVAVLPCARLPAPHRLYREDWGNSLTNAHLLKMSEHICKDAFYKVRLAQKVAEEYRNSYAFELGLLTASIYDRFHHMTKIYRFYVTIKDFKNHKYTLEEMMGGYSAMQSDYNQMRAETDLYQEIEDKQVAQEHKENILAAMLAKKYNVSAVDMKRLVAQGMFSDYQVERRGISRGFKNGLANKIDPLKVYLNHDPKWSFNPDNQDDVENIMKMNARSRRFNTDIKDEIDDSDTEMDYNPGRTRSLNMDSKDGIVNIIDPMKLNFNPAARRALYTGNKDELANIIETIKKPKRNKKLWNNENSIHTKNDTELKKRMRYVKWAEKWRGFNPETEGVHIPNWIARMGLANESNFLQKELKVV